ncbi:MAG TPA: hypothetical protein PLF76_08380 [Methanomassiliicoccaceae archaeon]|nr:hypothetical protein [Methanomassiliicoccaceae archaeon]
MAWNCLPCCIGSLPHTDPARAVDLVLEKLTSIPIWPQLPNRGFQENMYAQFATRLPGVNIDNARNKLQVDLRDYDPEAIYTAILSDDVDWFSMEKDNFSGFHELMSRYLPESLVAVKGQVTGPVSLGLQMIDQDDKPVIYDEAYGEIVRKNLNLMARWQERELSRKCPRTIIFLDEPYLSLIGTPFASVSGQDATAWINEVVEGLEGTKGLHCCANTDWPMVMATDIDLLSFDAYDYGHTIALYPEEAARFLEKGGAFAWGIIPNNEETIASEDVPSIVRRAEEAFRGLIDKGIDEDLLLRRSILTPQCGLSGLDESTCARVLDLLNKVSEELRARHSLD